MSAIVTSLAEALSTIPPQIATLIIAMIPIAELRGAIPVAVGIYKLPIGEAAIISIIGNMLPVWFLLLFFDRLSTFLAANSKFMAHILEKIYERTRRKLSENVMKYGVLALTLFVAIPLPVTGAWTGSLAAHVFGLPKKKAFFAILLGVIIAAIVISTLTAGTKVTIETLST